MWTLPETKQSVHWIAGWVQGGALHNKEVDAGGTCGVLFVDLAKAFDTVDHEILFWKLKLTGFKSNVVSWIQSNLSLRKQSTKVGNTSFDFETITCGVPQGSTWGLLLFLIYVNDLPEHLFLSKCVLYADDTALVVSGKIPDTIKDALNSEIITASHWFDVNKLSINIK